MLARKDIKKEVGANKHIERKGLNTSLPSTQHCSFCKKSSQNTRICQKAFEIDSQ